MPETNELDRITKLLEDDCGYPINAQEAAEAVKNISEYADKVVQSGDDEAIKAAWDKISETRECLQKIQMYYEAELEAGYEEARRKLEQQQKYNAYFKIVNNWEGVLNRPGMYMGKKSLFGLECLLAGVFLENQPIDYFGMTKEDWKEFEKWVREKVNGKAPDIRSFAYALQEADGDEEKGFDIWAEWFKEWKVENKKAEDASWERAVPKGS